MELLYCLNLYLPCIAWHTPLHNETVFSLVNSPYRHLLHSCFDKDRDFLHRGHWSVSDHETKRWLEGAMKRGGEETDLLRRKATMMCGANGHLGGFWLKNPCCRIAPLHSASAACTISALCSVSCQVPGNWERSHFSFLLVPSFRHHSLLRWLFTKPTAVVVIQLDCSASAPPVLIALSAGEHLVFHYTSLDGSSCCVLLFLSWILLVLQHELCEISCKISMF